MPPDEISRYNDEYRNSMIGHLGIRFIEAESKMIRATMPVDERTMQPFGTLCGGASLTLAEVIAGHGSRLLCATDEIPVGQQVSGHHLAAAKSGQIVTGEGRLVHKGRTSHVWNVDIFDAQHKLISTVRVVNHVLRNV